MIDSKQATEALFEINEIARRVRQSTIYQLSGLLIVMWGVLVFAGNLATWLSPRTADYAWLAVYVAGIAGSFAVSAFDHARTGIRSFDWRMLAATLLFFAFGFLCTRGLAHFTPRQIGTFWAIYFMLVYIHRGIVGRAGLHCHRPWYHRADADRLFLHRRRRFRCGWPLSMAAGSFWAGSGCAGADRWPNSTTSSISRCG